MPAFDPQATVRYYWVTGALTLTAPTVAQIVAGLRLDTSARRDGVEGFSSEPAYTDTTSLAATRETNVRGLSTTNNGKLTFNRGNDPADVESDLFDTFVTAAAASTAGNVVRVLNGAPTIGGHADIFPSKVASVNLGSTAGGNAETWSVGFTHDADPILNEIIA